MLLSVDPSTRSTKKYTATFSNGKKVHFGAQGYGNYIKYYAVDPDIAASKRRAYIARHQVTEDWSNPYTAATLSRYILWEHPCLNEAINAYRARFF